MSTWDFESIKTIKLEYNFIKHTLVSIMPLSLKQAENFPLFSIKGQVYSKETLQQVEIQMVEQSKMISTANSLYSTYAKRSLS